MTPEQREGLERAYRKQTAKVYAFWATQPPEVVCDVIDAICALYDVDASRITDPLRELHGLPPSTPTTR